MAKANHGAMGLWVLSLGWAGLGCGGGDPTLAPAPETTARGELTDEATRPGDTPSAPETPDTFTPAEPPPQGDGDMQEAPPEDVPVPGPSPKNTCANASARERSVSSSSACTVAFDQVIPSLSNGTDRAFFAFDGLADHTYTVELIATGACSSLGLSSSVSLEPFGQAPVQLLAEQSQGTTRVSREVSPTASGRIVIEVAGTCSYDLVVWQSIADGLTQDENTFEPNNTPSTATPLALDARAISAVTGAPDPNDFFAVEVTAGDVYTLDVIGTGACSSFGIDAGVTLFSEFGQSDLLGAQSQGAARNARELTPQFDGVAIVEVSGDCAYELAVLRSTSAGLVHNSETLEPNNSPSTATRLVLDEVASSAVISAVDPDDHFGVPVLEGRAYTLELIGRGQCSSLGISAGVSLIAASGTSTLLGAASQGTSRTARELFPTADGIAVVEVSGQCAYEVAVHQSTIDGLIQDGTTLEPNNSPSTGTALALDELVVSQTQSAEDPNDFFIVPVVADETYTLQLTGTGACSSLGISASATLSSEAGTSALLGASSQGTSTSARTFTASADGDAIVRIAGNCGYELQVLSP